MFKVGTLKTVETSLGVQWLRLSVSNAGATVQSLVKEVRSRMLCSTAKKTLIIVATAGGLSSQKLLSTGVDKIRQQRGQKPTCHRLAITFRKKKVPKHKRDLGLLVQTISCGVNWE